jgi:hypothetical protein
MNGLEDLYSARAEPSALGEAAGMVAPDGWQVLVFLLHIDGEDAGRRWSDEALPEPEAGKPRPDLPRGERAARGC